MISRTSLIQILQEYPNKEVQKEAAALAKHINLRLFNERKEHIIHNSFTDLAAACVILGDEIEESDSDVVVNFHRQKVALVVKDWGDTVLYEGYALNPLIPFASALIALASNVAGAKK